MTGIHKGFFKEHILGLSICISAFIQLGIIFFVTFPTTGGDIDKRFIPMTILPYVETYEPEILKTIEETADLAEASEEKNASQLNSLKSVSQGDPSNFLSFVKVDEVAKPTKSLMPDYPEMARNAGIEGMVVLEVYIDENGLVRKVAVLKGIGFKCEEAAIQKVKNTVFVPAKMGGKPIAVRQKISFEFKLR